MNSLCFKMAGMEKKLRAIGISSEEELQKITGLGWGICRKVWRGQYPMSLNMARKIVARKKTSYDYLLR